MKQEIPKPIAIGLIVVVLAVLAFLVYRWVSAPAATISEEELLRSGSSAPMTPPSAPAAPQGEYPAPFQPPQGYGAPPGG